MLTPQTSAKRSGVTLFAQISSIFSNKFILFVILKIKHIVYYFADMISISLASISSTFSRVVFILFEMAL